MITAQNTIPYKHTQTVPGQVFWAIALPIAALALYRQGWPGLAIVAALTAVYWFSFSRLTVVVDDSTLMFGFGARLFRQSIPLSNIRSYSIVKNHPLHGWGIRFIGTGWLYNVYGLTAVEIVLNDSRIVRVGTNDARHLLEALELSRH